MLGERLFNNVVPVATIVFIVFAAIATIVLNTTRFGRYVFAVGGNERAARISGVPVSMVKITRLRDHRLRRGARRHRPCRPVQFRQRQ